MLVLLCGPPLSLSLSGATTVWARQPQLFSISSWSLMRLTWQAGLRAILSFMWCFLEAFLVLCGSETQGGSACLAMSLTTLDVLSGFRGFCYSCGVWTGSSHTLWAGKIFIKLTQAWRRND
eukprot:jgi/Botrbrau1/18923/Bobra.177_2s0077.1